jgi:aminoglycoside phosphotransferase (APT) family kinase protein
MRRLPGVCDYYALSGAAPLSERVDLARRLCTLLSEVHAVDWEGIGLGTTLTDPGTWASKVALDEWEGILRRDQLEPYPELTLAAQWLRTHAPRSPRTVLVHADFKVGNVLIDDGTIVALLDWELAHLGDPHEDLGWVTQPLRRREHLIPEAWDRNQLMEHYQLVSGHQVDPGSVHWWNVFATYKTAVMQVSGLRAYIEGRSQDFYQPSAPVLTLLLDQVLA